MRSKRFLDFWVTRLNDGTRNATRTFPWESCKVSRGATKVLKMELVAGNDVQETTAPWIGTECMYFRSVFEESGHLHPFTVYRGERTVLCHRSIVPTHPLIFFSPERGKFQGSSVYSLRLPFLQVPFFFFLQVIAPRAKETTLREYSNTSSMGNNDTWSRRDIFYGRPFARREASLDGCGLLTFRSIYSSTVSSIYTQSSIAKCAYASIDRLFTQNSPTFLKDVCASAKASLPLSSTFATFNSA